eukprot:4825870-Pyramimonas_sp.AAC.1
MRLRELPPGSRLVVLLLPLLSFVPHLLQGWRAAECLPQARVTSQGRTSEGTCAPPPPPPPPPLPCPS